VGRVKPFRYLVAASALVVLGGCSTPDAPSQVASLTTPGTTTGSATSTAADPDNGRPRERIDMTDADSTAMYDAYSACLAQHGFEKSKAATTPRAELEQLEEKANAACVSKNPLPPWELDSSNPHAADFVHAVVQCLRAKGVRLVSEEPPQGGRMLYGFGGPQNDAESIRKGMELAPVCEKEVAARGIGK